jgi:hypothetical protein
VPPKSLLAASVEAPHVSSDPGAIAEAPAPRRAASSAESVARPPAGSLPDPGEAVGVAALNVGPALPPGDAIGVEPLEGQAFEVAGIEISAVTVDELEIEPLVIEPLDASND